MNIPILFPQIIVSRFLDKSLKPDFRLWPLFILGWSQKWAIYYIHEKELMYFGHRLSFHCIVFYSTHSRSLTMQSFAALR